MGSIAAPNIAYDIEDNSLENNTTFHFDRINGIKLLKQTKWKRTREKKTTEIRKRIARAGKIGMGPNADYDKMSNFFFGKEWYGERGGIEQENQVLRWGQCSRGTNQPRMLYKCRNKRKKVKQSMWRLFGA